MSHRATYIVACIAILALCVSAKRPGVIIHAVGDSATAGDLSTVDASNKGGWRFEPHLSYRRYIFHMLTARGYSVRFVGSKSDCDGAPVGLDFDSHHDGYSGAKVSDIRAALNAASSAVGSSLSTAVQSLKDEGAPTIHLVRVVIAGGVDAVSGRPVKEISDSDMKGLADQVEGFSNNAASSGDITSKSTLVIPSPPPGGVRATDDASGKTTLVRDFQRDSRYEDFRFFLTWRGVFFDKRKIAADCLSYFDFLRHYSADGSRLNALGDQALARCVFDNMIVRKLIPKVASHTPEHTCTAATEQHVKREVVSQLPPYAEPTDSDKAEPVLVNQQLPPLTTLVARAVRFEASSVHPTCGSQGGAKGSAGTKRRLAAEGDDGAASDESLSSSSTGGGASAGQSGKCLATPRFPEYEPFAETTKDLWKAPSAASSSEE